MEAKFGSRFARNFSIVPQTRTIHIYKFTYHSAVLITRWLLHLPIVILYTVICGRYRSIKLWLLLFFIFNFSWPEFNRLHFHVEISYGWITIIENWLSVTAMQQDYVRYSDSIMQVFFYWERVLFHCNKFNQILKL